MVLPSFAEGLPVVLMEAYALGRPAVATQVAGVSELVKDGVNGWVVEPGSVEALAEAMHEVLTTPVERLGEMAEHGRRLVAERHSNAVEAGKLMALMMGGTKAESVRSAILATSEKTTATMSEG
jgi:glycosyltransferase involved in cell wall biosynthesis